jgi:hypothetical protein
VQGKDENFCASRKVLLLRKMDPDGNGVLFEGVSWGERRNSRVKPLNGQSLQDSVALGRKKIFALERVSHRE